MDTCKGFCDNAFYAQLQRSQRRMFTAGALPIVLTGNDEAAACFFRSCGEFCIAGCQAVICQIRYVGTEGQEFCIGRHDMVCCDVVFHFDQATAFDFFGYFCIFRERLDIGASHYFYICAFGCGSNDQVIIYHEMIRHGN